MTLMRDRLIELLQEWGNEHTDSFPFESVADYLLENGVIVPKCKIGDDIYRIGESGKIYADWEIICIQVYEEEILYIDDSDNYFAEEDIGKTVFLTREEAEKALNKFNS